MGFQCFLVRIFWLLKAVIWILENNKDQLICAIYTIFYVSPAVIGKSTVSKLLNILIFFCVQASRRMYSI